MSHLKLFLAFFSIVYAVAYAAVYAVAYAADYAVIYDFLSCCILMPYLAARTEGLFSLKSTKSLF